MLSKGLTHWADVGPMAFCKLGSLNVIKPKTVLIVFSSATQKVPPLCKRGQLQHTFARVPTTPTTALSLKVGLLDKTRQHWEPKARLVNLVYYQAVEQPSKILNPFSVEKIWMPPSCKRYRSSWAPAVYAGSWGAMPLAESLFLGQLGGLGVDLTETAETQSAERAEPQH